MLGYGVVLASIILSLGPALALPDAAWLQLAPAAAVVLGTAALAARYLRRPPDRTS